MRLIYAACGLLLLLAACRAQAPDAHYDAVMAKRGDEQIAQFQSYPIEERFRLFDRYYAGHNNPHRPDYGRFDFAFRDKPQETLTFLVSRLRGSKFADFNRYGGVLISVAHADGVNICHTREMEELRGIVASYRLEPDMLEALRMTDYGPAGSPDCGQCPLVAPRAPGDKPPSRLAGFLVDARTMFCRKS